MSIIELDAHDFTGRGRKKLSDFLDKRGIDAEIAASVEVKPLKAHLYVKDENGEAIQLPGAVVKGDEGEIYARFKTREVSIPPKPVAKVHPNQSTIDDALDEAQST